MKLSEFFRLSLMGMVASVPLLSEAQTAQRPNILIILADDMGHGDLSFTGGKTPTPNIDRILKQGVRFSNFMVCPVSSPTRGGLLTGMHPLRIGAGPETGGGDSRTDLQSSARIRQPE